MKAVVIENQGGLENLIYRDWPMPEIGPDDVLVKVAFCGLNHLDIFVRRGMPGLPVRLPFISGGDIAGTVHALGARVDSLEIRQRVLLNPSSPEGMLGETLPGGMAEFVRSPASHAIPIPDDVSLEHAATLPVAYGTAWRMLHERAELRPGEDLLVLGASGGVGTATVQIAKNIGARVIACAGTREKCDRLAKIGADETIAYLEEDFSKKTWQLTNKRGVDCVVNFTGGDTWVPSLRCLRRDGRLVTCGATAGFDPQTDIRFIWVRELRILGSDGWSSENIHALLNEVAVKNIEPVIDRILLLESAQEAERMLEERSVFGKILLRPS